MCAQRVFYRSRNAADRGLVQDVVDAFAGGATHRRIGAVAPNEAPLRISALRDHAEVRLPPRREIVEAHDMLTQREQSLDEVRADEAGCSGYEPTLRAVLE